MTGWQYVLVGDTGDHDIALAAALQGARGDLVRTVEATSVAEIARPDGSWHATDRLLRITYGDIAWTVPITPDEAHAVVTAWLAADRLTCAPDLAEAVPDGYQARAQAQRRAATLRDGPALPAEAVALVRGMLLDESAEIAASWLSGTGRVAVPVQSAIGLNYADEIERARTAFAAAGATTLWAVSVADEETIALWGVPAAVEVPNEDDWLGGVASVYFATGDVVLTNPGLDVAILQRVEYGVVAGPVPFVRTVLGVEPDDARLAFRRYLRGESYRTPTADLSAVAERYGLGREKEPGADT